MIAPQKWKQGSYHTWSAGACPRPTEWTIWVHKKFSILFVQTVLYYHQRAPGWADPGRYKKKYAMDFAGRKTIYQTIQGQRGWRWPLGIYALFRANRNF